MAYGGPPLLEKRDLYVQLVSKGLSNTAACRVVGIQRRTGRRWKPVERSSTVPATRGRMPNNGSAGSGLGSFFSEAERIMTAVGALAGLTVRCIADATNRSATPEGRSSISPPGTKQPVI